MMITLMLQAECRGLRSDELSLTWGSSDRTPPYRDFARVVTDGSRLRRPMEAICPLGARWEQGRNALLLHRRRRVQAAVHADGHRAPPVAVGARGRSVGAH